MRNKVREQRDIWKEGVPESSQGRNKNLGDRTTELAPQTTRENHLSVLEALFSQPQGSARLIQRHAWSKEEWIVYVGTATRVWHKRIWSGAEVEVWYGAMVWMG